MFRTRRRLTGPDGSLQTAHSKLLHWFDADAAAIIRSYIPWSDGEMAYAHCRSQLDKLFGTTDTSAIPTLRRAAIGPQLKSQDWKGHIGLFTILHAAPTVAMEQNKEYDLNRTDLIQDIVRNRLDHMATQIWAKDAKLKYKQNRNFEFDDLMEEISQWIKIAPQLRLNGSHQTAKVAAAEVTTETLPPRRPSRRPYQTEMPTTKQPPHQSANGHPHP